MERPSQQRRGERVWARDSLVPPSNESALQVASERVTAGQLSVHERRPYSGVALNADSATTDRRRGGAQTRERRGRRAASQRSRLPRSIQPAHLTRGLAERGWIDTALRLLPVLPPVSASLPSLRRFASPASPLCWLAAMALEQIVDVYATQGNSEAAAQISSFVSEMFQADPTPTASSAIASVSRSVLLCP